MSAYKVTIEDVLGEIKELRKDITENYVSKVEFAPVKGLVYGFVALALTALVGALVTGVIKAN